MILGHNLHNIKKFGMKSVKKEKHIISYILFLYNLNSFQNN